jgi:MFS family permease
MQQRAGVNGKAAAFSRVREVLGLERNVLVMSVAVFLLGAGEELWKSFFPKYLEALGAGAAAVGLFGTFRDFLDAVYQYPGGYISDRIGGRRALILFSGFAILGYTIYALSWNWQVAFLGLLLAMAWPSMGSPAIFTTIADSLPGEKRAMGFTVQSILKRVPVILSPILGGLLIGAIGLLNGVRVSLLITIALALLAILIQKKFYFVAESGPDSQPLKLLAQIRSMHTALKRLLISDVFIRTCESLVSVFVVLYVINIAGATPAQFGILIALQMAASILAYFPAARLAETFGKKPFVAATFIFFSLFPVAVVMANSFKWLVAAFVIGGLRELGEPARKAMIVDLAEPARRGRTVGLYYLLRSLAITPAAFVGGLLWNFNPAIPFLVAGFIGLIGTAIFVFTVRREYAA